MVKNFPKININSGQSLLAQLAYFNQRINEPEINKEEDRYGRSFNSRTIKNSFSLIEKQLYLNQLYQRVIKFLSEDDMDFVHKFCQFTSYSFQGCVDQNLQLKLDEICQKTIKIYELINPRLSIQSVIYDNSGKNAKILFDKYEFINSIACDNPKVPKSLLDQFQTLTEYIINTKFPKTHKFKLRFHSMYQDM